MAIKLSQSLKQTQTLTMTPQLQQAIKLLTLSHLEMTNVIASEMVENPMLEELGVELDPAELSKKEIDHKVENIEADNKELKAEDIKSEDSVSSNDDFDWNKYIESTGQDQYSPPNMATRDSDENLNYENIVSRGLGLQDHLLGQLRMENFTEVEQQFVTEIIHNLAEDGYLATPINEIMKNFELEEEDAFELLEMVKNCDPVGCGSSNLIECLLSQARNLEQRMPLVEKIIQGHLENLNKMDYQKIADELGVERDKVKDAELIIKSFNPRPGRLVSNDETHYIIPDIFIVEISGEFQVKLNDEGVPRLKISKFYQKMLKDLERDPKSTEYIQDKLRSAQWLIKSIENRQRTIVKVAEAILKHQPDFFRKGAQYLRPMILKDIAMEIGMHESTVSRVTTNKYMHTPLGVFELKYFFNTGLGGKNGGLEVASESIKIKIKKLIENENKKSPLSDQKIVEMFKDQGIDIARRTVAKYRELMNIQSSSKRKKINS